MAKSKPETIILRVKGGCPLFDEYKAEEAINPGHLVEIITASANRGQVQKNGTAGARIPRKFAIENDYVGEDITDAYSTGDRVKVVTFQPGEHVYVKLAASAAAIVEGDILTPHSDGTMAKHSTAAHEKMAIALEDVDNSSGTSEVFLAAEII